MNSDVESSPKSPTSTESIAIRMSLSLLREALEDIPFPKYEDQPIIIADYGCGNGENSSLVVNTVVDVFAHKKKPKQTAPPSSSSKKFFGIPPKKTSTTTGYASTEPAIVVTEIPKISFTFVDLPSNDWFKLFQTYQTNTSRGKISYFAVGSSFYQQVLPESSVHFAFSASSVDWLSPSTQPATLKSHISDSFLPENDPQLSPFLHQAKLDWLGFLRSRANELVKGGKLFMINPAIDRHPSSPPPRPLLGTPSQDFTEISLDSGSVEFRADSSQDRSKERYEGISTGRLLDSLNEILREFVSQNLLDQEEYERFTLPQHARTFEEFFVGIEQCQHLYTLEHFSIQKVSNPYYHAYISSVQELENQFQVRREKRIEKYRAAKLAEREQRRTEIALERQKKRAEREEKRKAAEERRARRKEATQVSVPSEEKQNETTQSEQENQTQTSEDQPITDNQTEQTEDQTKPKDQVEEPTQQQPPEPSDKEEKDPSDSSDEDEKRVDEDEYEAMDRAEEESFQQELALLDDPLDDVEKEKEKTDLNQSLDESRKKLAEQYSKWAEHATSFLFETALRADAPSSDLEVSSSSLDTSSPPSKVLREQRKVELVQKTYTLLAEIIYRNSELFQYDDLQYAFICLKRK